MGFPPWRSGETLEVGAMLVRAGEREVEYAQD